MFVAWAAARTPSSVNWPPVPKRLYSSSKSPCDQLRKNFACWATQLSTSELVARSNRRGAIRATGWNSSSIETPRPWASLCSVRACGWLTPRARLRRVRSSSSVAATTCSKVRPSRAIIRRRFPATASALPLIVGGRDKEYTRQIVDYTGRCDGIYVQTYTTVRNQCQHLG